MLNIFKKPVPKSTPEIKEAETFNSWINYDLEEEGHLSVDVFQSGNNIIVKATIAGAKNEDIEVVVNGDMLIIKGERRLNENVEYDDYLYRECYWGRFARTIILPVQIDESKVEAKMENGVLTIILHKAHRAKELNIKVKE
ncbi:MAG: Hsp20/alpha crystallin family protein [Ignavibacteria bacterium]|nr:Hsp20/alpha crystallin family protein [Ignavibacteria bacterium]